MQRSPGCLAALGRLRRWYTPSSEHGSKSSVPYDVAKVTDVSEIFARLLEISLKRPLWLFRSPALRNGIERAGFPARQCSRSFAALSRLYLSGGQ